MDDLENPCLDYVQHIVLGGGGGGDGGKPRTFVSGKAGAGGKVYTDFSSVKADFLSGELTEDALKEGLVECVDGLVAPVRDHFTHNAKARDLLARIQVGCGLLLIVDCCCCSLLCLLLLLQGLVVELLPGVGMGKGERGVLGSVVEWMNGAWVLDE